MRLILCAALLLLAGCASPTAPDAADVPVDDAVDATGSSAAAEQRSSSPPADADAPVVVRFNTSYDQYTGTFDVGLGHHPEEWDAAEDLALPRPLGSLLFELRCQRTGGTADQDPGYYLAFDVQDGGDATLVTMASGNRGACAETKAFDRTEHAWPSGTLTGVRFGASDSLVGVDVSYDVQLAITWFDADTVPSGYSAFP